MSESNVRALLRRRLKDLHAKSIENRCERGTPDMCYIYGWIELKWVRAWPARNGIVRLPHYTIQQRLWLNKHWTLRGRAFLGLVAAKEWFLWAGCDASPVGFLTREQLYSTCLWHSKTWNENSFRKIINAERSQLDWLRKEKGLCDSALLNDFSLTAVVGAKTSTKQQQDAGLVTTGMSNVSEE